MWEVRLFYVGLLGAIEDFHVVDDPAQVADLIVRGPERSLVSVLMARSPQAEPAELLEKVYETDG